MFNRESEDLLLLEYAKTETPTMVFAKNDNIVSGSKPFNIITKLSGEVSLGLTINNKEQRGSGNHRFAIRVSNDSGEVELSETIDVNRGNNYSDIFTVNLKPYHQYIIEFAILTTASSSNAVEYSLWLGAEVKNRIDRYLVRQEG